MQRSQKIARALREVAERTRKIPDADGVIRTPKSNRKPKLDLEVNPEPLGEISPTDVLTGNYRKRPGNFLYKRLLREEAPNVLKEEMRTVVNRIIEAIYNQNPPGRFIREGNTGIMTRGQTHQKVARALREVLDRTAKEGEDRSPDGASGEKMSKKKAMLMEKQEPLGEIRPTDVMTGNYRKRVGNALYKRLLREHAPLFGNEETSVIVNRIIDGISNQDPPGRFVREGGGALLTRGQVRQKIARALREVVDRTRPKNSALDRQMSHLHGQIHDNDLDNIKMEASEGERYYDVKMEDQSFEDHMADVRMNYDCKMEGHQVDTGDAQGEGELETSHGRVENSSLPEYGLISDHVLSQDNGQVEIAMGAINNMYDISEGKPHDLHQMSTKNLRDEDADSSLDIDSFKRRKLE
jgi:ribosomal protein S8E